MRASSLRRPRARSSPAISSPTWAIRPLSPAETSSAPRWRRNGASATPRSRPPPGQPSGASPRSSRARSPSCTARRSPATPRPCSALSPRSTTSSSRGALRRVTPRASGEELTADGPATPDPARSRGNDRIGRHAAPGPRPARGHRPRAPSALLERIHGRVRSRRVVPRDVRRMNDIFDFVVRHGHPVILGGVLRDQGGIPRPAVPPLLVSGALGGTGRLSLWLGVVVAMAGCLTADLLWYTFGRRRGAGVLGILCRITLEPDSCVRRTEELFIAHRLRSLVIAKFVPGLNPLPPAPPGRGKTPPLVLRP